MDGLARLIKRYIELHRKNRQVRTVVSILACMVVFATTYMLIYPALTLEKNALCGIETHEHTKECYTKVLCCDLEETDGHKHSDECYETEENLVCEQDEHVHDEDCYDEDGSLICELQEHEHDDDCYEHEKILVCDQEEQKAHQHDSSCYKEELACGKEVHIHTKDCYQTEQEEDEQAEDKSADEKIDSKKAEKIEKAETEETENTEAKIDEAADAQIIEAASRTDHENTVHISDGSVDADQNSNENSSEEKTDDEAETPDETLAETENGNKTETETESAAETERATETTIDDLQKNAPAVSFVQDTDELTVKVYAEEGTFPEGTTMKVTTVDDQDTVDVIADSVKESEGIARSAQRIHAVDITFLDTQGSEIEPVKPVCVIMEPKDDKVKNDYVGSTPAEKRDGIPVVVHVNDEGEAAVIEQAPAGEVPININTEDKEQLAEEIGNASENTAAAVFAADAFSVYAVVYTVDFHYEVNGKMYEFSIPGGGFASFYKIVEVLGIATDGENSENTADNAENGTENDNDFVGEVPGVDVSGENGEEGTEESADGEASSSTDSTTYEEAIKLNEVEVREATKKFVADVESVEFSSPELVWVGKVDAENTVGGLKEANGLEVEYSAELTEEQIAEINAQTVDAGDWAFISMRPFTSNETLTVIMKNGDRFVVRVTDGQQITDYTSIVPGREYIIYVVKDGNQYYALRNNGNSEYVGSSEADLENLGSNYIWNYGVDPTACWWYSGNQYLNVDNSNDTRIVVGSQRDYLFMAADNKGGFDIYGYRDGSKHLSWDTTGFKITNQRDVSIRVYMKDKKQFDFTVAVNNDNYGSVSCAQAITNESKTNKTDIVAMVKDGCYFSGWRLGDEILTGYGQTIQAGTLQFPQDNMRLTALFGKNYTSQATQEINEWVDGLLGNPILSDKTAHVYDYDNRVYEVDISASSMRYTINSGLTLEFITDASRSMYFPAQVTPVTKNNHVDAQSRWL